MGEVGLSRSATPPQTGSKDVNRTLKKQAKNLHRFLPGFLANNRQPFSLNSCLELIAKTSGFPSWHAASTAPAKAQVKASSRATKSQKTFYPVDVAALPVDADFDNLYHYLCIMNPDIVVFVNGELPLLATRLRQVGYQVEVSTVTALRERLQQREGLCGFEVEIRGDRVLTGSWSAERRGRLTLRLPG